MFQITLVRESLDSYRSRLSGILSGLSALNPESESQRIHRDALFDSINLARESGANRPIVEMKIEKSLAKADGFPRLYIRTATGVSSIRLYAGV